MMFVAIAATFYLIGCFTLAAWAKLRDFVSFVKTVRQILPAAMSRAAPIGAAVVIAAEIAIAALLVASLTTGASALVRIAAMLAIGAGVVFAGAIATVLLRGDNIPCHCFGQDDAAITLMSLAGPSMTAIAGLTVATGGAWTGTLVLWIAGACAGGYLLIFQQFVSHTFGGSKKLRQT